MNTIKKINFLILAAISMLVINSCVQDDDFALPPINCGGAEANLTLEQLKQMIDEVTPETTVEGATEKIIQFDQEYIIEGYIVSSDSTGNFFKTVSVQNSVSNPTIGVQIEMDRSNLFNNFPLGTKVKVALTGLYAGYDRSLIKIGEAYNSNGEIRVGRMAENKIDDHVAISCDPATDIAPVTYSSIEDAMDSGVINTLVKIENVQFAQTGVTYANAANQETVNLNLEGATAETNDQTMILRTSGFADFANVVVPEGSGSITAVLSKYNSEWQLFIRDTNDVQFNNPRYGGGGGTGEGDGPIGGDDAEFQACVNEGFNGFDPNDSEFGAYINDAAVGGRYWEVKEFGGNKYIQMSAFNSNDNSNVTYFIVPVNFTDADEFSFKTKDGYNNGNALSVYYSTDYTIGGNVAEATLTDITSSFNISTGNTNGYGVSFLDSGVFDLSSISGNGAILFKYEGSGNGITTTIQIDDISVVDEQNPDCGNGGGGGDEPNPPADNAIPLFAGHDFENWTNFIAGLNSFGIKSYATQSAGNGMSGTASLNIQTTPTTTDGNDYVFTSVVQDGFPTSYNRITFYMKGSSDKSVSLNVYKDSGYYVFNLGDLSSSSIISVAENNQYTGTINTEDEWVLIELDLSGITDLTTTTGSDIFALKIGKNANYDLHFDNFTIE